MEVHARDHAGYHALTNTPELSVRIHSIMPSLQACYFSMSSLKEARLCAMEMGVQASTASDLH